MSKKTEKPFRPLGIHMSRKLRESARKKETIEPAAGHYERIPIESPVLDVERRFTVGRFVPAMLIGKPARWS